jgi:hypothetical protein
MRDALELVGGPAASTAPRCGSPRWCRPGTAWPASTAFWPDYIGTKDTPYTRALGDYSWTAQVAASSIRGVRPTWSRCWWGPEGAQDQRDRGHGPAEEFFAEFDLEAKDEDGLARKMRGCWWASWPSCAGLQCAGRRERQGLDHPARRGVDPEVQGVQHPAPGGWCSTAPPTTDEFLKTHMGERRWLPSDGGGEADIEPPSSVTASSSGPRPARCSWTCGVLYARAERLAKAEHHKFKVVDSWSPRIAAWLDEPWEVDSDETPRTSGRLLADDVLTDCLGLQSAKITKRDQMRVAGILRELGMEKVQKRVPTSRKQGWGRSLGQSRVWTNAGDDEAPRPHRVPTSKR